jgi:hypothetical protein
MRRSVFAEHSGVLYVRVDAVMAPIIPFIDGLAMTFFGRGKKAYLKVDDAIEWCRKERECHSREKYDTMIDVMGRAKRQIGEELAAEAAARGGGPAA